MRVVIVHNRYRSANPSGENRVVESDIEQLRADGVEVIPYIRDSDEIDNFTALGKAGLAVRPVVSPVDSLAFRRLLREVQPHIVHLHNPFPLISPWIIRTAKAQRVPVVQTVHNYRHVCVNGIQFRDGQMCTECVGKKVPWPAVKHGCYQGSRARSVPMAAALMAHRGTWDLVDRFLPVGEAVADHLRAMGIEERQIEVRPNVVADPGPPTPLGDGVLFVGRLSPEKGIGMLLEAWRLSGLGKTGQTLSIAGDGELRPVVESAARADASIRSLGYLGRSELDDAYRRCGLVVVPSLVKESDGVGMIAGWAHERPVLATNLVAAMPSATPPVGWTVAPTPIALAQALRLVMSDTDERVRRCSAARRRYEKTRSPEVAVGLVDVYWSVLDTSVPAGENHSMAGESTARDPTVDSLSNGVGRRWVRPLGFPPRVELLVSSEPFAASSTAIYPPQRATAFLSSRTGIAAARLGIRLRGTAPEVPIEEILDYAGLEADGLTVMRSSRRGRQIIGVERAGTLHFVIKLGTVDDDGLRNEIEFLKQIGGKHHGWDAPRLAFHGDYRNWRILVTRAEPVQSRPSAVSLTEAVHIVTAFALGVGDSPPLVHGDLVPWNCRRTRDGIVVVDWEKATHEFRPMWDLVHFVIQQGALLGKPAPELAVALLLSEDSPISAYRMQFPGIVDANQLIVDYLEVAQRGAKGRSLSYLQTVQQHLGYRV